MAEDFRELEEHAEEAAQHNLAPVTVTMAILAVLIAAVSLLGHRAHTEEMLMQTKATDHWAFYQAKEIRTGRQNQRKIPKGNRAIQGRGPGHPGRSPEGGGRSGRRAAPRQLF